MQKIHHYLRSFRAYFNYIPEKLSTPVSVILGAVIIASSIIAYGFIIRPDSSSGTALTFAGKPIDSSDYVEGSTKNDVFVVEYSDTECPYCILASPTLKQLRQEYGDRIAFVYRHFPLTQIHPNARDESRAITCAGIVGGTKKYYEYVDALFGYKLPLQTQTNPSPQLPAAGKEDLAKGIGLDATQFSACMSNNLAGDIVDASTTDGIAAGVDGTPMTFVLVKNRKGYDIVATVSGAQSYDYFKAAVDEALSK